MRAANSERGQTTVELALCLPILVAVLAAAVEVGLLIGDQARLWHAAREAARIAVVDPDEQNALAAAESTGLRPIDITIDPRPEYRVQAEPLTVELTYEPDGHVPLIGDLARLLRLSAEATMRIEEP